MGNPQSITRDVLEYAKDNASMISRARLLRTLVFILGITLTVASAGDSGMNKSTAAQHCRLYKKGTWYVDLNTRAIERIGIDNDSETLCAPLPTSGTENVKLVILKGKRNVFERQLYVNLAVSFDYQGKENGGQFKGGTVAAPNLVFSSILPADLDTGHKKLLIRLIKLDDGSLLGQGQL